jgi:hypothetical protein
MRSASSFAGIATTMESLSLCITLCDRRRALSPVSVSVAGRSYDDQPDVRYAPSCNRHSEAFEVER